MKEKKILRNKKFWKGTLFFENIQRITNIFVFECYVENYIFCVNCFENRWNVSVRFMALLGSIWRQFSRRISWDFGHCEERSIACVRCQQICDVQPAGAASEHVRHVHFGHIFVDHRLAYCTGKWKQNKRIDLENFHRNLCVIFFSFKINSNWWKLSYVVPCFFFIIECWRSRLWNISFRLAFVRGLDDIHVAIKTLSIGAFFAMCLFRNSANEWVAI